jgi:hypothetical protein
MNNPLFIKIDTIESKYADIYNKMNSFTNTVFQPIIKYYIYS